MVAVRERFSFPANVARAYTVRMKGETSMPTARTRVLQSMAAVLLLATVGQPAAASVAIDIGRVTGQPGNVVAVPISISGASNPVGGLQVDITFSQAVLSVANPSSACSVAPGVPGSASTALVDGAPAGMGRLRVILFDVGGGAYANGTLVTCNFDVAANAPGGLHVLQGSGVEVSDPQGNAVPATVGSGSICTGGCCP